MFIHTNLCLLACKDPKFKRGAEKLWDIAPKFADLDMTVHNPNRATPLDVDDEDMAFGGSSASGANLGDNEDILAAWKNESPDEYFDNLFDD